VSGVHQLPDLVSLPGSRPLRKPAHERYARARSLLMPKIEAYRYAGLGGKEGEPDAEDIHAMRGNASKLERKQHVIDRIAYLCRQDEEVLAEKRKRLEELLWMIHDFNPKDLWEVSERPKTNKKGEPVLDEAGNPIMIRYERPKFIQDLPEDVQRVIEGKGEFGPQTYSKMQANQELRKLLGIGLVSDDSRGSEFERMSDQQLIAELSRQANELGINITLTYGISGDVG
jgi:hypothetical protein